MFTQNKKDLGFKIYPVKYFVFTKLKNLGFLFHWMNDLRKNDTKCHGDTARAGEPSLKTIKNNKSVISNETKGREKSSLACHSAILWNTLTKIIANSRFFKKLNKKGSFDFVHSATLHSIHSGGHKENSNNRFPTKSGMTELKTNKISLFSSSESFFRPHFGFTLVELIVVISILAILGAIAFLSFSGYSSSARDSTRLATVSDLKTGLDLYMVKAGTYPLPDNIVGTGIINSVDLTLVGDIGDSVVRNVGLSKIIVDPLTNLKYTYGTDTDRKYYQIATILEKTQAYNTIDNILSIDNALAGSASIYNYPAGNNYQAKVSGNYNGLLKKKDKLYNLPSLIFTSTTNDLSSASTYFVVNGERNLPGSNSGTISTSDILKKLTGKDVTLTGVLAPTTTEDFNSRSGALSLALGYDATLIGKTTFGSSYGVKDVVVSNDIPVTYSCTTQPSYTNATFTIGTPTQANQVWQNTNSSNPCYYTCINGYSGNDCSIPGPYTNCTTNGIILSATSTYPGCNSNDIIVCSGSNTGYTLAACNVGSNLAGTGSNSYGYYFQWGNNGGNYYNMSVTSTTIDTSSYGPGNYYNNSNLFVGGQYFPSPYDWSNPQNNNLWGNTTNTSIARQGPCSTGYHVPSNNEFINIISAGGWGSSGKNMGTALKLPFSGYRARANGTIGQQNSSGHYWTSSPGDHRSYYLYLLSDSSNVYMNPRIMGFNVRCMKN